MRKDRILQSLRCLAPEGTDRGVTATEIAGHAGVERHNASADLNELCREGLARKTPGRPVLFWAAGSEPAHARTRAHDPAPGDLDDLIGASGSLRRVIEQAKAAILYPPRGLPTLVLGGTGAGKSRLAEAMHRYAVQAGMIRPEAPFGIFNCADYAANPQLLVAQLFGYVKGAFTGADRDNPGLIAQIDGGILLLDEIHRLPPEGQEMLFLLIDKGAFRSLGDSHLHRASIMLIGATSEDPRSNLLQTFLRRFPVVITMPNLEDRPLEERLELINRFLHEEATRVGRPIAASPLALVALLSFRASGNVGELRSAVLLGCARAFLSFTAAGSATRTLPLYLTHLAPEIQLAYLRDGPITREADLVVGVEDRLYAPSPSVAASGLADECNGSDVYRELGRRIACYRESGLPPSSVQHLIHVDLANYVQRLLRRKNWSMRIPDRLLEVVEGFLKAAGEGLGCRFGPEVMTGLALHLGSRAVGETEDADSALTLAGYCPQEFAVVRRLVPILESGLGFGLPPSEITFLSLFLAAHRPHRRQEQGIAALVIAHGEATASSMAVVANRLLGRDLVLAVDMPLEQSIEETRSLAVRLLQKAPPASGILLLVDMGSLTVLGPAIEGATGLPVAVVPLVTTAAVIEAGRLVAEGCSRLELAVRYVNRVYQTVNTESAVWEARQIVLTTCLTGQGTARKLAAFLAEALPGDLRERVAVQPLDLETGSDLPGFLVEGWRGRVVAATGTLDPKLPGVPFIGMEQILFGDGLRRLVSLLGDTQEVGPPVREVSHDDAVRLARRFVEQNLDLPAGAQIAEHAVEALGRLEYHLRSPLRPEQVVRWLIHLAFLGERLVADGPVSTCQELEYLKVQHGDLLSQMRLAVRPLEEVFHVTIPEAELGLLVLAVLTE